MLLTGWKEIAEHPRCGMRTVQRWERLGSVAVTTRNARLQTELRRPLDKLNEQLLPTDRVDFDSRLIRAGTLGEAPIAKIHP